MPSLNPVEESERQPFPTLRLATEPTLDDLTKFAESQLRGKRATFYAHARSSFAIHLTSYLTAWGVDVEHRPDEGAPDQAAAAESGPPSFIIIDDDISILRKRLIQLRSESIPTPHPRKRPTLAANHRPRSSPHIRPLTQMYSTPVVIHFTSLAKFKIVRDVVQSVLNGANVEVLVIPKPAGPRRCLVALYTALARPLVDPVFSPIATSPASPSAAHIRAGALRNWNIGGTQRPSPLAIENTTSREYFSETAELLSVSPSANEGAGVVLQDLEGRPAGILFQPKRTSTGTGTGTAEKSVPGSPTTPANVGARKVSAEKPVFSRTRSGSKGEKEPVRKNSARRGSGTEVKSPGAKPGKKKLKDADIVPPINVLIVEDNPINQMILSQAIKRKKIKCDVARDGQQAVEKWKTGKFHLIFMDIQMPVMDGIEATREIRRLEKVQHGSVSTPPIESPGLLSESKQLFNAVSDSKLFISGPSSPFRSSVVIVALTASSLQADRLAALAAGCNDFLTKPVELGWLDKKIIEWGSIKALQMWADPDMVRKQEAKAKAVAGQLRIDRAGRKNTVPGGTGAVTGKPEIHVQAPTPPVEREQPSLVRRTTKSPSPLSRSMVLPGPPPVVGNGAASSTQNDAGANKAGLENGKPSNSEPSSVIDLPPVDSPTADPPVAPPVADPVVEPSSAVEPIPSISAYPLAEAESYFPPSAPPAQPSVELVEPTPIHPPESPAIPSDHPMVLVDPGIKSPSDRGALSPSTETPYQSANSLPPSPS